MKSIRNILESKTLHSLANNILIGGVGFINFILLSRILTPDEFGKWGVFIAGHSLLDLLRVGIFQVPITRLISSQKFEKEDVTMVFYSSISLSLFTILILGLSFFLHDFNGGYELFIAEGGLLYLCSSGISLALWVLQAEQKFLTTLWLRAIMFIAFCFYLLYVFASSTDVSMWQIALVYITLYAFVSILGLMKIRGYIAFTPVHVQRLFPILSFGKFTLGTAFLYSNYKNAGMMIAGAFFPSDMVGLLNFPFKFWEVSEILTRSFMIKAFPELTLLWEKGEFQKFKMLFRKDFVYLSILQVIIALTGFLFTDVMIHLIGGQKYAESTSYIQLIALIVLTVPVFRFIGSTFETMGRPVLNTSGMAMTFCIHIIGFVFCLSYFETIAAVIYPYWISSIFATVFYGLRLSKILKSV